MKVTSLEHVVEQVDESGYFVTYLHDISSIEYEDVESQEFLLHLISFCEDNSLEILPKIVTGSESLTVANIERSLNQVKVVFYSAKGNLAKSKVSVKSALVVGKIASAISRVDGKVDKVELDFLHNSIYSLNYLTSDEKYLVFVRSVYWSTLSFSREALMSSLGKLSITARKQVLKVSIDITVSDCEINKNEVEFLKDIYRLCDIPTKNVLRDLKARAKELHLPIARQNKVEPIDEVIEFDNSLEELLSDFEGF